MSETTTIGTPFRKSEMPIGNGDNKGHEKKGDEEKVPDYSNQQLYMGTYLHLNLEHGLTGDPKAPMEEYSKYLETHGIGEVVSARVSEVTAKVVAEVKGLVPEGYSEPIYLTELSFMPSNEQVDLIQSALRDEAFGTFLKGRGLGKINEFIKDALTSTDGVEFGEDSKRSWEDIYQISRTTLKPYNELTMEERACKVLSAVSAYYYLDLETPRLSNSINLEEISESMRKVNLSAAARPDFIGVLPKEDITAQERQVVEDFTKLVKGTFFGKRPLHEVGNFSDEEVETVLNMFSMMLSKPPKVALQIGEIKAQIQSHVATNETPVTFSEVVFDPDHVGDFYYQDMAHTTFAMYQFFSRMMNYKDIDPEKFGGVNPRAMLDLMRASEIYAQEKSKVRSIRGDDLEEHEEERVARERLREIYEGFKPVKEMLNPPNKHVLVRMFYPVYDPRIWFIEDGLDKNAAEREIQYKVDVMDPRQINLETQKTAENFVRRLNKKSKVQSNN